MGSLSAEKDKMLAGELYLAADPELADDRRACRLQLEWFNASTADEPDRRRQALIELLDQVGEQTEVQPPFFCDYGYNIRIGGRCCLNFGVVILDCARVSIGDDVQIGPNVALLAATHPLDPDLRRAGLELALPVTIEDGAWLGAGVSVLPGVTVGADSVIGAGSVVLEDVPPLTLAAGNPCRVIRNL